MTRTEWKAIYREFRVEVDKWINAILKKDRTESNRIWNKGAGAARFDFIHQMRRPDPLAGKR